MSNAPKKYAILGDIHANLEALLAVLDDARGQGCTDYACVGDLVGYNIGSVGESRDGNPAAAYVTYDLSENAIELRRVPYDFGKTEEKALAAGLALRRKS